MQQFIVPVIVTMPITTRLKAASDSSHLVSQVVPLAVPATCENIGRKTRSGGFNPFVQSHKGSAARIKKTSGVKPDATIY